MGKSELAAAVALLLTCGDGEERGEVYGCAADRQQASIVFEVAADMVRMCPALNKRVKILASQKRIVYQSTNSFYQVLSAEAYSKHGFNIHGVVFDELHTQPNRKLFDVMTKGSGDARTQPLYEELFSVIAVLKKQWNNFNSDVYFKNENVKMIYSLLYARPEVRNINIGYSEELLEDAEKAKKWYINLVKKIHPDANKACPEEAQKAMTELEIIYERIQKCFANEEEE